MSDMERKELDSDQNGLYLETADEDGIHICEKVGDGKVYVYYSELPSLIKLLQEYVQ